MAESEDRFTRGAAKMSELDPSAPDRVIQTYKDIAPDLSHHVIY